MQTDRQLLMQKWCSVQQAGRQAAAEGACNGGRMPSRCGERLLTAVCTHVKLDSTVSRHNAGQKSVWLVLVLQEGNGVEKHTLLGRAY